ncbi:MAG: TIGR03085 family metal-binding protein [Mycobacteriales bacterium]
MPDRPGVAAAERATLCDLLDRLGPDAPTLCGGWTTGDLAAHLLARETRPDVLPGLVLPGPAATHTARVERQVRSVVPYDDLVERLRGGPPVGLFGLPVLAEQANIHEFFVHLEDVRRGQPAWSPRRPGALPAGLDGALWGRLRLFAPLLFRRVRGLSLALATPDGRRLRVLLPTRGPEVTVTGDVPELFLFAFNRIAPARVELSGAPGPAAQLERTRLGP